MTATTGTRPAATDPAPTADAAVADQQARFHVLSTVVQGVGLIVLGTAVALGFDRVFVAAPLLRLGLTASIGALLVSEGLSRGFRARPSTSLLVSALTLVLVAPLVVGRAAPGPASVRATLADLADAPRRILSLPLPVEGTPALVGVVFFLVWAAVAVAAELARRTDGVAAPLAPIAVAFAPAVLLGATGPAPSQGVWSVIVVVAAVVALVRSAVDRPDSRVASSARSLRTGRAAVRHRLLVGLPVVLLIAVLAPGLAPHAPGLAGRDRLDRRSIHPRRPDLVVSPLARVDVLADEAARRPAFTAVGPKDPVRFHVAVLDRYDGTMWRAPGGGLSVASQFPPESDLPPGRTVTYDVTVTGEDSGFLPVPGRAIGLTGEAVVFDPETGNVRPADGSARNATYRVTGIVPDASDAAIRGATATLGPRGTGDFVTQESAGDVAALTMFAIKESGGIVPGEARSAQMAQLTALAGVLSDDERFVIDENPKGGESLNHLRRVLTGQPGKGRQLAASREQLVSGFAVMARLLGHESRVVVGYRYTGTGPIEFDTRDIRAWAEVRMDGVGWVPFDIDPQAQDASPPISVERPPPTSTPQPQASTSTTLATTTTGPVVAATSSDGRGGPPWLLLPVAAGVLLLAALGLRRPLRRWRRRQGDPSAQVTGAWAEAIRFLHRRGLAVDDTRTVTEVADASRAALSTDGHAALVDLGRLVIRTGFAPAPPAADVGATAWDRLRTVERSGRRPAVAADGTSPRRRGPRRPPGRAEGLGE